MKGTFNFMQNYFVYKTPRGPVTIASNGVELVGLLIGEHHLGGAHKSNEITNQAANQLQEYFAGKRTTFDLALAPQGTDFQKQVWKALQDIPYGQTRSYREIAEAVGNPKAYRAVGSANNKNPLHIVIPCHRVIGSNGQAVGYAAGIQVKEYLLDLERKNR